MGRDLAADLLHVEVTDGLDQLFKRGGGRRAWLGNTRTPSLNAISIGIEVICAAHMMRPRRSASRPPSRPPILPQVR